MDMEKQQEEIQNLINAFSQSEKQLRSVQQSMVQFAEGMKIFKEDLKKFNGDNSMDKVTLDIQKSCTKIDEIYNATAVRFADMNSQLEEMVQFGEQNSEKVDESKKAVDQLSSGLKKFNECLISYEQIHTQIQDIATYKVDIVKDLSEMHELHENVAKQYRECKLINEELKSAYDGLKNMLQEQETIKNSIAELKDMYIQTQLQTNDYKNMLQEVATSQKNINAQLSQYTNVRVDAEQLNRDVRSLIVENSKIEDIFSGVIAEQQKIVKQQAKSDMDIRVILENQEKMVAQMNDYQNLVNVVQNLQSQHECMLGYQESLATEQQKLIKDLPEIIIATGGKHTKKVGEGNKEEGIKEKPKGFFTGILKDL